ncbi:hypothetical protein FACS189487_09790 [Campylobacterota bacterium]|nr:hypothetical protein FACS189487_09790 [Campylobacterota bacterium]
MKTRFFATFLLAIVFVCGAFGADSDLVNHRDFVNFYISDKIKQDIRDEILRDVNISFEDAKAELYEQVRGESERQRRLYVAQIEEISRQLVKIKEELDFVRELVVDANYLRNSNIDVVSTLQKEVDALRERLKTLEGAATDTAPPETPQGGRKL